MRTQTSFPTAGLTTIDAVVYVYLYLHKQRHSTAAVAVAVGQFTTADMLGLYPLPRGCRTERVPQFSP